MRLKLKPYIQPFEKVLAIKELEGLIGSPIKQSFSDGWLTVPEVAESAEDIKSRLAYWERVRTDDGSEDYTLQVLREATASVVRNGVSLAEIRSCLPFRQKVPVANRRVLRYGSHGIHEYRGKFFPQLVVSLMNWAGLSRGSIVVDPMCGSGTTVLEGLLHGMNAYGLDLNPLSVFMAKVKADIVLQSSEEISVDYEAVREALLSNRIPRLPSSWFGTLDQSDQEYLGGWFSPQALQDMNSIMAVIETTVASDTIKSFMRLALSNVLRKVSWQKEEDLRVRREVREDIEIDVIRDFLEELGRSVRLVLAFLRQEGTLETGHATVLRGDAREANQVFSAIGGQVDAIITSPPYATALPYLDTDRLSLVFFKLLTRKQIKLADHAMIGNREISEKERRGLWAQLDSARDVLPGRIIALIQRISSLNDEYPVGFRRKNLPSLLLKYFLDMRLALRSMHDLLREQGVAYVVIGNNQTTAGGEKVLIDTINLLAEVAEAVGFAIVDTISMEMLASRDIFKRNAINAEIILCLKRSS